MARAIEIIDPEGEKREVRRRRALTVVCIVAFCLFAYPELRDYSSKWRALKAGHKLARFLSSTKTKAILDKTPLEVQFRLPDLVEVFQVSSCGPGAERNKISESRLADLEKDVVFAEEKWVRQNVDSQGAGTPILPRFCYDPIFGSSLLADGIAHGGVFLAHSRDVSEDRGDHVIEILIEGASGDISIE